jgi:hypothetical protein
MKNAGQDAAGINRFQRLAVSPGVDASGHRLPCFITNQTDRKLVSTLAGKNGRALDPFHGNGSQGPTGSAISPARRIPLAEMSLNS